MTKRTVQYLVALIMAAASAVALAHGGGLDSYGGHNDRKHGGYHFHQGPLAGRSFASKSEAIAALNAASAGTKAPTAPTRPLSMATTDEKLEALITVLKSKGVLTDTELQTALARQ